VSQKTKVIVPLFQKGEKRGIQRTIIFGEVNIMFSLCERAARQERQLSQEELGKLIGVRKAQISKLESSANSATIDTILKVFRALKAEINFNVKLEDNLVKLA
jgi:DNA-binding XRE family transcriptional regulator